MAAPAITIPRDRTDHLRYTADILSSPLRLRRLSLPLLQLRRRPRPAFQHPRNALVHKPLLHPRRLLHQLVVAALRRPKSAPDRGTTDLERLDLLILRLHLIEKLLGRLARRALVTLGTR